ncbi:rCG63454 [Rattus norvegicus]|uniref:RCG63454 n=1 Tax=Rattus norvegicus TaxID=10116 RepID=A6HB04_RAT|nr:rCG63454 [Rattus norvegicus]
MNTTRYFWVGKSPSLSLLYS